MSESALEAKTNKHKKAVLAVKIVLLIAATGLVIFDSELRETITWKIDEAKAYARGVLLPKGGIPVAGGFESGQSGLFAPGGSGSAIDVITDAADLTATAQALPQSVTLTPPEFDVKKDIQGWNNCGPATLALGLRIFGWKGDQYDISTVIKPLDTDKNVNPSEMADYVAQTGLGLSTIVRVNGTDELVMRLLAAGTPVIIEESFKLEESFWPGDDLWAAHYLLITGYDLGTREWSVQDSYYGPNRKIAMDLLAQTWKPFNRLVFVVYKTTDESKVRGAFGADWDAVSNMNIAAAAAKRETDSNPNDAFAWFNLGDSLLGAKDFDAAAAAFARARGIGLPQRMLRYQFGPLEAAYKTGNIDDLFVLANYALDRTPNSEEALTWKGHAYILSGQVDYARKSFERALEAHPGYAEAEAGLKSLNSP